MHSSRNKARRGQDRSGRNRTRRAASSSNIEVSQSVVHNEPGPLRRQAFASSSSDLSYPVSGITGGHALTPSGTSDSPLGSSISDYPPGYGAFYPDSSQQSNSTCSWQQADSEMQDPQDACLHPAPEQWVPVFSEPMECGDQFPPYAPHTDNEDPPNRLPSQSDSTGMSLYQPQLTPTIDPHILQIHGQPTMAAYQVDWAYLGHEPQVGGNLSGYSQIQSLPDGAPTYYHLSQVPPEVPWSALNVQHRQVTSQSAFNLYTGSLEQQTHPPSATPHDQYVSPQSVWGIGYDGQYLSAPATETVELPSSDDPVGPPIDFEPGGGQQVDETSRLDNARGGRRHGPLDPASAKNACKMRKEHVCMSCRMLREACVFDSGEDVCRRCKHKSSIPGRWSCDRTQLQELVHVFLPRILFDHPTHDALDRFLQRHITGYVQGNPIPVQLTPGFGRPLVIETIEAHPKGSWMLSSRQLRRENHTDKYEAMRVPSPSLVIIIQDEGSVRNWRGKLESYLDTLLVENFESIPGKCFPGRKESNRISRRIMVLLYGYYLNCPNKAKEVPGLCLKLIMLTFMMSHAFTLVEETRHIIWEQLCHRPDQPYGMRTSARYLNKQLKYLLSPLINDRLERILSMIQQKMAVSKKSSWTPAFAMLSVLAMVGESLQLLIRCKEYDNQEEGSIIPGSDETQTLNDIEETSRYLTGIFHIKYTGDRNKFRNPLYDTKTRSGFDDHEKEFIGGIHDIIEDYLEHLKGLDSGSPFPTFSEGKVARPQGRLLAHFLLSLVPDNIIGR